MHFYPRSPCGERPLVFAYVNSIIHISIHALLAESDHSIRCAVHRQKISIHALLAESDHNADIAAELYCSISIHALLAESDMRQTRHHMSGRISIHALLAESDAVIMCWARGQRFLSTLSLRRATVQRGPWQHPGGRFLSTLSLRRANNAHPDIRQPCAISIHALLAESDYGPILTIIYLTLFLSTLSLRRATILHMAHLTEHLFLSTLSLRRAT